MLKGYAAIVGSRNTPEIILEYLIRIGRTLTDMGYAISSGDAYDADRAGWYGALQAKRFREVGCRIFVNKSYRNGYPIGSFTGFIDSRQFTGVQPMAEAIALKARGTFAGLNKWGIELHTRNVYQILGSTLEERVEYCILYAPTVGKDRVSGGTNTAFQIAKTTGVPTIINLYTEEGLEWAKAFLAEHEQDYPYRDIDWYEIHKPDDPRLKDFEE